MFQRVIDHNRRLAQTGAAAIGGRAALAVLPLLLGAGLIVGGLPAAALSLLSAALVLLLTRPAVPRTPAVLPAPPGRQTVIEVLDRQLTETAAFGDPLTLVVEIDRYRALSERYDHATMCQLRDELTGRLGTSLRATDLVAPLDPQTFAVVVSTGGRMDLADAMLVAGRLQRRLSEPLPVSDALLNISVSIGFALPVRLDQCTGEGLLEAALLAAHEAHRNGPSAIRSYSSTLQSRVSSRNSLARDLSVALSKGEISAWFQPQVNAVTGTVTGLEALARWHHPQKGLVPPSDFLPAFRVAGLMETLGDLMVREALDAIRKWDEAGLDIPSVAVNFSHEELSDSRLVDRITWELDRHELTPDRLVVEVLETVVASGSEDIVIRNLSGLARLGCRLDLDDFGTGHAAITSIRRFAIERIKIDRSFVTRIDADPEQQKMVSAILTMAERLGLETLAEGVETEAEHAKLAELGCGHLQGYGIARPMPMDEASRWLTARQGLEAEPTPMRRAARS